MVPAGPVRYIVCMDDENGRLRRRWNAFRWAGLQILSIKQADSAHWTSDSSY